MSFITEEQVESLYELHDEIVDADIRKEYREGLTNEFYFRRLFAWQFERYQHLLARCLTLYGEDQPEFKEARSLLRKAEGAARAGDVRLGTSYHELALQFIHKWLDRIRKERARVC